LITTGAKSGQERHTTLAYVPEGDNAWLITGSAGGAVSHPAWYFNIVKNPDKVWVQIGDRKIKVRPESLKGDAREHAYRRFEATAKSYSGYPHKTDREIPVLRLTAT
jgi:deazaflavin-dependent oxidoreductase (nitroreductase family)